MILFNKFLVFFTVLFLFSCSIIQIDNSKAHLKHVKYLASDELEGRYPGSAGDRKASQYIKDIFSNNGLQLIDETGYQHFDIITNSYLGVNNKLKINNLESLVNESFIPLSFGLNTKLTSEVYFAGYGFNFQNDTLVWNDYKDNDCSGKWVMILRGSPDNDNPHGIFSEHSSLRKKAIIAKDNSAAGVIFVSSESFDSDDKLIDLSYDQSQNDIGIPIIHIKRELANKILLTNNTDIFTLENQIKSKLEDFKTFNIDIKVEAQTDVKFETDKTQNVIGYIPGKNKDLKNEYIVVGAHYDHIGFGGSGSSSRRPYINDVHNGADDNASGISILLELSKKINQLYNNRTIYFVAFGAEEMGLIGSKFFVDSKLIPNEDIQIMINLDMVGRLNDKNILSINGTKTAENLEELIKSIVSKSKINATYSNDGYGPSDHASFYIRNVPVMYLFTGGHNDYHTPNDDYDKLNYKGLAKIEDFVFKAINEFDNFKKLKFQKTSNKESNRPARFKVTLGIMPDYVFKEVKGLRIDAVTPNRPAYNAGIVDGDIIIEINYKSVSDIYEYMHRLSEINPGETYDVKVLRDDKELIFSVTF